MRILLVSIYDMTRSGGLSSHVEELAVALSRAGHEARLADPHSAVGSVRRRLVADLPRLLKRFSDRDDAFLHFLVSSRSLLSDAIARLAAQDPVDVVHAHDPLAFLAARDALPRIAGAARVPLVLTVHGDLANMAISDGAIRAMGNGRRASEGFEAEAYRSADVLIAVDQRLARHCAELSGRAAIEVFANFVDTERFHPATEDDAQALARLRRSLSLGESERILLATRRLVVKNGVLFAVRALAERALSDLAGGRPVLLVAGKGPQSAALEAEADRLGLGARGNGRVRFLGDVSRGELPLMYRLADAVLIPSVPDANVIEATSISALEAMASGRVVIASGIGGLAEMVRDGRTGVLVPPGDAGAIAAAAAGVLADPARAGTIGRAARAFVEAERSSAACVSRLVSLYAHGSRS